MTAGAITPDATSETGPTLRHVRLSELTPDQRSAIIERSATVDPSIREQARTIVDAVRTGGDDALRDANRRFGGALASPDGTPAPLRVDRAEMAAAAERLDPELRAALETMATNIRRFHEVQVPPPTQWVDVSEGIRVGRLWRPLGRVCAYVPGGSAAYPSSLLMASIPARLAGVRELVVASPAGRDGRVSPALLGAAALMDVDEFLVMGGAQAIGAVAFGTESIKPVDKIVGPGNAWVTAAKLEVMGHVAIDMPAGPSEVMVVADDTAEPMLVAADLLSQAEHGPNSPAVLVTSSARLAEAVIREVARQLPTLPRQAELRASIATAGLIVETVDLETALAFADAYAPEHLSVVCALPDEAVADAISSAGSLFIGRYAPESAGDYATGSNHILPTGRLARAYGALSVEAFGHWLQVQTVTRDGLAGIRGAIASVAEAEGLTAHRRAVELRFETQDMTDG